MANAFDLDSLPTPAMIPAMKAANIKAVLLYTRLVTRQAVELLSTNGIDVVFIAEWGGGATYSTYTAEQGIKDANRAIDEVKAALGYIPVGKGIYFCGDDFDANSEQINGGIMDYLRAVKNVLSTYAVGLGVYGNGLLCQTMLDAGVADKAFLWAGRATNGTLAFAQTGRASIQQEPTTREFGASVDPDEVSGDYWGIQIQAVAEEQKPEPGAYESALVDPGSSDDPTPAQGGPSSPTAWYTRNLYYSAPIMTGDDVSEAQRLLGIPVDGQFGRQTQDAVRAFQKTAGIDIDGIIGPATAQHMSAPK